MRLQIGLFVICVLLVITCALFIDLWRTEKAIRESLERVYTVCQESRDYFQELSDEHWQMYWDCHNQQEALYPWR